MHLLASKPGGFTDEEGIVVLAQSAADLIVLSAADTTLAALAAVIDELPDTFPSVRLANWMQLIKPAAYDLYEDKVLSKAHVVVVSLLGGKSYWSYGLERLQEWQHQGTTVSPRQLIVVPGDDEIDPELVAACSVDSDSAKRVWRYLREGGLDNSRQLMRF